ncbi:MAG: hypothetical protein HY703_02605 [Gemmatimonadetes bacterium]|nr:hypothetical protein [Gemmatimonadota bacterium]
MLPRRSLERRLFGWLFLLALVPALGVLGLATWSWTRSLEWVGTLGPWGYVAETGRAVFQAADSIRPDPELATALARHREELSSSLLLARRWSFLGQRLTAILPLLAVGLAVVLALAALAVSRRLAQELAQPIAELVDWAERLSREEALPAAGPHERREVREVRVLREALRRTAAELAAARRRALEAERLRVWGEMARRVAHEMKNPLTPLHLAAHRLSRAAPAVAELREPITVIQEESARLEELAREFAELGRPPAGPRSAVDLKELLGSLLASDVPPGVAAALHSPPELPLVEGHYEALVRTMRNLLRNAVEAVAGRERREIEVRVSVLPPGGQGQEEVWIEIVIGDTGPGLPDGAGERIFEPDFTTKSRGTGLGLALVRKTVAAHGGGIEARNRTGGGAEFVLRLPAAAGLTPAGV